MIRLAQNLWCKANDLYLGIDTQQQGPHRANGAPGIRSVRSVHNDGVAYEGADYRNIRRILRILDLSPEDVFFDIGSGKGRVLCMVARQNLRRVVGIELSPELCEIARRNAETLRAKKTPIEVRCEDAVATDLSGGTVFFLYNPFGAKTLNAVLNNIQSSLKSTPRKVTVVYYNAIHSGLLRERPWLKQTRELRTLTGRPIEFWRAA